MLRKIFKKKENLDNNYTLIASLLVHAAKIDENYTDKEKTIIKKALIDLKKISLDIIYMNKYFIPEIDLKKISLDQAEKLLKQAEEEEAKSN